MSIPPLPLPDISGDLSKEECDAATAESLNTCFNSTGAYCYEEYNTVHPVQCKAAFGLGTGTSSGNVTCLNVTVADLCPAGHYCILGDTYPCPAGHFCPEGTADAYPCTFSHLSCQDSQTADPNQGAVFIMLVIFFTLFAGIFRWYGKRQLENDMHNEWVQIAINVSSNIYDAVNGVAMEHDQHAVMKTIVDIRKNILEREKKVSMGEDKLHSMESGRKSTMVRGLSVNPNAPFYEDDDDEEELENEKENPEALQAAELRLSMPTRLSMNSASKTRRSSLVSQEATQLMGKLQVSMAQYKYDDVKVPINICFQHMFLSLKANNATVLSNISVNIKPSEVTAIMGPSGAGKTTLLSLLRGHATYAKIRGSLTINGHAVGSLEMVKHRIGYVPQDDIVSDELTVEDNILYSALLFNKRGLLTAEEVMPMVLRAETLLDISHIRTAVVGSAAKRGISGGQKKRVSIGMELMKEAELFFLDEPTSGLDSASSMLVVNALHFLASKGVNVCATIHQPRQEILNLMDNLLLLAPGGRVVYHGPIVDLHRHFSSLGYTCPVQTNIADYVMDTLCGFVPQDNAKGVVRDLQETIEAVCSHWEETKYPIFESAAHKEKQAQLKDATTLPEIAGHLELDKTPDRAWRFGSVVQWFKVLHTCCDRQVRTNRRTFDSILVTCAMMLVFGMVVAFLIGPVALDKSSASVSRLGSQVASGSLVFALLVQSASTKLFAADELLRDREFTSGLIAAPYFLGKIGGNFAELLWYPFAFMVGYYPFLHARAPFTDYWGVFVLLQLSISALVNFIVIAYPASNKSTFCVGVVVLFWSFGGINPPLEVMKKSMSTVAVALNSMAPFKYSYELELVNELSQYPTVWNTDALLDKFSYHASDRGMDVGALIGYFCIANFAAYAMVEARMLLPGFFKDAYEKYTLYKNAMIVQASTNPGGSKLAQKQREFELKLAADAEAKRNAEAAAEEVISPMSTHKTVGFEMTNK